MKVFLDTNVYIAEALLPRAGGAAESMLVATTRASWRIFVSVYVLDEVEAVYIADDRTPWLFNPLGRLAAWPLGKAHPKALPTKSCSREREFVAPRSAGRSC